MSTYTCPHCGQHDLSTQRRHNCPKPPSLSIPLGPPRSMDPCANEYIARLTRELEEVRAENRRLREALTPFAYLDYDIGDEWRDACEGARRALATDTEGGEAEPPAHPVRMAQPDEEMTL